MAANHLRCHFLAMSFYIRQTLRRMQESIVDAGANGVIDGLNFLFSETSARRDTAERNGQCEAFFPPLPKILQADKAFILIGKA